MLVLTVGYYSTPNAIDSIDIVVVKTLLLYTCSKKFPQGKQVRVVRGVIYDVAVDTRIGSPTYGEWYGVELSSDNKKQFYIPEGFAHGFYVISNIAVVCFKVSDYWHPNDEIGIPWNDPELKINWPIKENEIPIIADKDLHYDSFSLLKEKLVQREEQQYENTINTQVPLYVRWNRNVSLQLS